jgi:hypothetical protein
MGTNGLINLLFILILLAVFGISLFILPRFMLKRAMSQVIRVFRYHRSLSKENAKTVEELGLKPHSFMERFMKPRDYKPYAIQILTRQGILCQTEDGRLYLSEEKLNEVLGQKKLPL